AVRASVEERIGQVPGDALGLGHLSRPVDDRPDLLAVYGQRVGRGLLARRGIERLAGLGVTLERATGEALPDIEIDTEMAGDRCQAVIRTAGQFFAADRPDPVGPKLGS